MMKLPPGPIGEKSIPPAVKTAVWGPKFKVPADGPVGTEILAEYDACMMPFVPIVANSC
jgi:hypothetical protein